MVLGRCFLMHRRLSYHVVSCHKYVLFFKLLLALLLLSSKLVMSKHTSGTVRLSGVKTEQTLMKFALSPYAGGRFDITVYSDEKYYNERNLKVHLYREEGWWNGARKAPTCQEKIVHARKTIPLRFIHSESMKRWVTNADHPLDSSDTNKKTYWYVLIDDCSLEEYYHDNVVPKLDYEINIYDDTSGSYQQGRNKVKWNHLSADEQGIQEQHRFAMFVSIALIVYILVSIAVTIRTSRTLHIALLLLLATCVFDAASNFSEAVHMAKYERNGIGYYTMDALASHFEAVADSTVAILLLFVGCGWTLPTDVLTIPNNNNASSLANIIGGLRDPLYAATNVGQGNPAALLIIFTYALNTTLAQCSRLYDDDFDSYHSYEHLPGRIQMSLRCLLGVFFLIGVNSVRNGGKCPQSLRSFLVKFMLLGFMWFLLLPLVSYLISKTANNHSKNSLVTKFTLYMQQSSYIGLTWLFTSHFHKNSAYHNVSKVTQSDSNLGDSTFSNYSNTTDTKSGNPRIINSVINIGKTKLRID